MVALRLREDKRSHILELMSSLCWRVLIASTSNYYQHHTTWMEYLCGRSTFVMSVCRPEPEHFLVGIDFNPHIWLNYFHTAAGNVLNLTVNRLILTLENLLSLHPFDSKPL